MVLESEARTKLGERCILAHQGWEGEKSDFFSILLAKVFHEHGGQGKIDSNARDVIGRRYKRASRNGRIHPHSLQQDGHERRHTG